MKRYLNILLAVLFIVFAAVQLNDPDPWFWVMMYLYVAVCILLFTFTNKSKYPLLIGALLSLAISLSYIPDVVSWVKDGMPSIASSMKAESLYIELVREFFGLLITGVTFIFYYFVEKKRS
jgi:hypothetical protein